MGLNNDDTAELLLVAGYEWVKKRSDSLEGPRKILLTEVLDRIVAFYEICQNLSEATHGKAERSR